MLRSFTDGVFLTTLAPVSDPGLVWSTVAQSLGLQDAGGRSIGDALVDFVRDRRLLLVLDNFEHVLAASPFVAELLTGSPGLKILVTSRAPLHLHHEHELLVPPLELPDLRRLAPVRELARCASVALFIRQASAVDSGFALNEENARSVAEICCRLDGLPLAIELAAARVKLLPPQALLRRLDRRLAFLNGGARDLPARQQTLRATIAWSHDLLDAGERRLFRRLAIFSGGTTLEAATRICDLDGDLSLDVLEGVASLLDKSLLLQTEGRGEPRFSMLETVREFGLEQLEESGELLETQHRHVAYYLDLVEKAEPEIQGPDQLAWLRVLDAEYANIRAALAWAEVEDLAAGTVAGSGTALRMVAALYWFWMVRGYYEEGCRWIERALAANPTISTSLRSKALTSAGILIQHQGDFARTAAFLQESLALSRKLGDVRGVAWSLGAQGRVTRDQGDLPRARELLQEGLALFRGLDDKPGIAFLLFWMGSVSRNEGDLARSTAEFEECLALFRTLGHQALIGLTLGDLGRLAYARRDHAAAAALLQQALVLTRESGFKRGITLALYYLGLTARESGDIPAARTAFQESLEMRQEIGDREGIADSLERLAGLMLRDGEPCRAGRLLGAAEAMRVAIGAPRSPADRATYERNLEEITAALGEDLFATARAQGWAMTSEQAIAEAMARSDDSSTDADGGVVSVSPISPLSRREQEVAILVARGLSNRQIATELVIAPRTAENHVEHILDKLGVSSRTQIATWVFEHGLLAKPTP